jgi:nitroreductase
MTTTTLTGLPRAEDYRTAQHPIDPLFIRRWSPRAMSGEAITRREMLTLFEAARWAPSTYNEQEWRFVYALRETPHWQTLFDLLADGNRLWCDRAAMLVVILAKKTFSQNGQRNPVHLFDCGNAFENLALQGTVMGLVVHGMQGFDFAKARDTLKVPDDFDVAAMFAVGRPGDPAALPEQLREMERPSDRRAVADSISEGAFAFRV